MLRHKTQEGTTLERLFEEVSAEPKHVIEAQPFMIELVDL